jgi:hypothetical protein
MVASECVTMRELCYPGPVRMKNGTPIMLVVCKALTPASAPIVVIAPRLMAWRAWAGA